MTDGITVSRPPFPSRNHQSCRLVVPPVHPELSRRRRLARGARNPGLLRSDSILVSEVRSSLCSNSSAKTGATRLFIAIQGQRRYLWRVVDQDGDVIDILVTKRRDRRAAKRFFRRALKHQRQAPWQLITDKLRSYPAAHREIFPSVVHRTGQYENNRSGTTVLCFAKAVLNGEKSIS